MEKTDKAIKIGKIVFNSIWCAGALFFWILGLTYIWLPNAMENKFISWMFWGIFCAPFIILFILKFSKKQAEDSARDGSRHYTYNMSTGVIKNHTFSGYVTGFLIGLVGGVAAGPIFVPLTFLNKLLDTIKLILDLKNAA